MQRDNRHLFNPVNERGKYRYRIHLRRALKKDEKTLVATLKHIRDFEIFLNFESFEKFSDSVADKYISSMFEKGLSLSYINDNIRTLKEFLRWLERQKGYRSKLNYNHIDYLNISANQRKTAKATEYKKAYTYNQILSTIRMMPVATIIQKRNKAVVSLQALCGLRISELRTLKLKNLIEEEGKYFIYVNPKDMEVKYAKTRHANFMSLPDDIIQNVLTWRDYLIKNGFTGKDAFFPQINNAFNQHNLLESSLSHNEIRSNTTIRDIFRNAFEAAGCVYIRPHSFRHTIARIAERKEPAFFNAVRQSLGHSSIDTTFNSYGALSMREQANRISNAKLNIEDET